MIIPSEEDSKDADGDMTASSVEAAASQGEAEAANSSSIKQDSNVADRGNVAPSSIQPKKKIDTTRA